MTYKRTELRLPAELHAAMLKDAERSKRTLNAHIAFVLEWWLESPESWLMRVDQHSQPEVLPAKRSIADRGTK